MENENIAQVREAKKKGFGVSRRFFISIICFVHQLKVISFILRHLYNSYFLLRILFCCARNAKPKSPRKRQTEENLLNSAVINWWAMQMGQTKNKTPASLLLLNLLSAPLLL